MIPTPELRFVEREVVLLELSTMRTIQRQRILQQFWSNGFTGEWRDVPVVQETQESLADLHSEGKLVLT